MSIMRIFTAVALLGLIAQTANADLIDDFSGDLSNFTQTIVLDANDAGSNTTAFEISGGALQLNTTAFDGIEQIAFVFNGLSLGVGDELRADIQHNGGSQDLGLYVGGVAPTAGVRTTFITSHSRDAGQVLSAAFDGDDGGTTVGFGLTNPGHDSLFITRTGLNDYEAGSFAGGTRVVDATYTGLTGNDASFVGIYADVRSVGVLGSIDNLSVIRAVPEPSSIGLLGMAACALVVRRRRK